jgi:hypothetical protein
VAFLDAGGFGIFVAPPEDVLDIVGADAGGDARDPAKS